MKIERISENQIRCTLNRSDLEDRKIKLSELAYGSDKARGLFAEMMAEASHQLDFQVDNIPLMVEAIPLSPDCIVLIITKVTDPDELDSRFSRFSPPDEIDELEDYDDDLSDDDSLEEIAGIFRAFRDEIVAELEARTGGKIHQISTPGISLLESSKESSGTQAVADEKDAGANSKELPKDFDKLVKVFSFRELSRLREAARIVSKIYHGPNSLYRRPARGNEEPVWFLLLHPDVDDPESFSRAFNALCEYGRNVVSSYASEAYFKEHFRVMIEDQALEKLAL